MIYSLNGISKGFKGKKILDIHALDFEKGYIYALLGPNGSGKTTLLNIMGFLDRPSSGHITFNGSPVVFNERLLQKHRQKVVMVQQNPILFTTSVLKNMEFGLKIRKIPARQRMKIIEECLDMVDLRHMINAPAHKLSGGETQRVVLARALALSPEVILCDEPTASVDLENQITIARLLRDINAEKGITLIFTSHDKQQASSLPHFKLYLDQGKVSVMSYENTFHAGFHPVNEHQSRCIIQNELQLDLPVKREGPCRLHIKPEQISLFNQDNDARKQVSTMGKILRISEDAKGVRVGLDCGIHLTVVISEREYKTLGLLVGENTAVHIPPEAVSIFD